MADEKAMRRLRIENRRAKTAAQRSALKARYGAQTNLSDGDDRCCCVSAVSVRITVNLMFCILGILVMALGIWAATGNVAGIFGAFPGVSVIVMSILILAVGILGEYGARADNKCILLVYMLVIFAGFLAFVVLGSATAFGGESVGQQAERAWCAFPESAARGQEQFGCCGFQCPSDRPAMGSCPGGASPNSSAPLSGSCAAGHDSDTLCAIRPAPVNSTAPGCRGLAVGYLRERLVPLFIAAFVTGVLLFAGLVVACSLLCRRTRPGQTGQKERGMEEATSLHDARAAEHGWIGDDEEAATGAASAAASSAGPRGGGDSDDRSPLGEGAPRPSAL